MAKKSKTKKGDPTDGLIRGFKEETVQATIAILFFVAAAFLGLAAFDKAGFVGEKTYAGMKALLGVGYFLLPLAFIILGGAFLKTLKQYYPTAKIFGSILFLISGLGLTHLVSKGLGGSIGSFISSPLVRLFDVYVAGVILGAIFLIALLIIFEPKFTIDPLRALWSKFFGKKELEEDIDEMVINTGVDADSEDDADVVPTDTASGKDAAGKVVQKSKGLKKASTDEFSVSEDNFVASFKSLTKTYAPPPLSLLEKDKGKPEVGDIKANANIIKRTLLNFGISVEMDEVSVGPSVTRYALKPAEGVKLSRIVALQNDLALALAAHPIRIEAPIPGKSLVGIEIPNTIKSIVGLATILGHEEYQQSDKPLIIGLGKSISGKCHFANLAKMPHALIAGATGSGKSVMIHTLITSLLFRNSAENLKFIMIDPKRVELTLYNKIPHLLTPVITESKKAILALKWAAKEMDRRYDILESESVRDIDSYHKTVLEPAIQKMKKGGDDSVPMPELMPYIVIVIDELADIMTNYPREMEAAIVRLAQMSRAVGIHLVLSTQRPSVNVITGLIKANIPARIALQVASQIDSRTILDTGGAEKLLGAGDLLFLSGEMSKPLRIQSPYISETEVKKVAKYLKDTYADELQSELNLSDDAPERNSIFDSVDGGDDEIDDDLYEQAREEVIRAGKASTSYIQRKLRVGYARAARLMDVLEEKGVIGPADGSRPRDVLVDGAGTADSSDAEFESVLPSPDSPEESLK